MKKILVGLAALAVATIIWLPCLHLLFARPLSEFRLDQGLSPKARQLAARHLQLWTDPALREQELNKMRASNAEWDFMGRSYLVWSLANMSLRDPASKPLYLQTMDQIIDETLRLEKQEGMYFFLMPEEKQPTMTLTQPQIDSPPTETPQPTDDDTLGPGPVPTEEYPPEIPSRDPSDGTISDNERYYRQLAETLNAALNISPHEEKNDSHLHRRRSHHLR